MITDKTGYVTLGQAAKAINRSTARTRQYLHDGVLGVQGEGWDRDEMGRIQIATVALAKFTPPAHGNMRAKGINPRTHLRHLKATRKLVQEMLPESDTRRVALACLVSVMEKLVGMVNALEPDAGVGADGEDAPKVKAPKAPKADADFADTDDGDDADLDLSDDDDDDGDDDDDDGADFDLGKVDLT